jgi:hypothetical protein
MNKLLASTIAVACISGSSLAYASSTVTLAVPANNVIEAKSELALPIDALTTDVPYMVTCNVDSTAPAGLDMSLAQSLAPKGGFGVARVNDKPMSNNVGTLNSGHNTVSFMASVSTNKDKPNQIIFKNLDARFTSVVKSCEAKPVSNVTDTAHQVAGGYFYVSNNLGYYVDITVGNYTPTGYCLPPYSVNYILVSTAYQNIAIVQTHY